MTVGLKFCGGCNPRYDRSGAAARLRAALPWAQFVPAAPGCAATLVVCGCDRRCADVRGLDGILFLDGPDVAAAAAALEAVRDLIEKKGDQQ